jgi:hypothetical protein
MSRTKPGVLAAMLALLLAPFVVGQGVASAAAPTAVAGRAPSWSTRLLSPGPTHFTDVSCASPTDCTAVGGGPSGRAALFRTSDATLETSTDGGADWTVLALPEQPVASGVAATPAGVSVLVGADEQNRTFVSTSP